MNGKIFCFFLPVILAASVQVSGFSDTYRAAVLEYHTVSGATDELTLKANVQNFIKYIEQASKKKADIIVFPETALIRTINHPIPKPTDNIVPCNSSTFKTTEAVKSLSCASKNNKIYTVVNLLERRECEPDDKNCPSRGYYLLNSNVVFDRAGMVIARYSKYNLYDQDFDGLKEPEIVFFDTDFGVRFGTFICFDIMFPSPGLQLYQQYKINDFVFTTRWFSETPFLTALQVQRGWAEAHNVNLLASGLNYPRGGSAGSGIYNGNYGHLAQSMPDEDTTQLLIADVPKIKKRTESNIYPDEMFEKTYNSAKFYPPIFGKSNKARPELELIKDQMHLFTSEVIGHNKEVFEQQICGQKGFCCNFRVAKDVLTPQSKNYTIRAAVLNGVRTFGKSFRGGVQVCGVIVCNGPEIMSCTNRINNVTGLFKFKEISIKGNFNAKNGFQMPTTLSVTDKMTPLPASKYEFIKTVKSATAEVTMKLLWPVIDMQVFGIWGRDFTRDREPKVWE